MATSKLELAVGTGQWDAGLKKAQQALNSFTQSQGGLQQALRKDNEKMVQFVQMMGKIDSTANTAKGQLRDYRNSIEQLSAAFNSLSDAQKKGVEGQTITSALDSLKAKAMEAKQEVERLNVELSGMGDGAKNIKGGGLFSGMGDKMSGALQVFAGNMLTKAAGAVAQLGSEMYDMVQQGIELARQGEGIRVAFERLGRGDILDGLRQATHGTVTDIELMKAAVKFNDFKLPIEELGTMLAFAQQKAKDTGQSVDYMVDSIVTGLGRKSLMILDNLGLSASEIKDRMAETGDMTKAVGAIIRDQMAAAGDYVETAADRAAQANVDLQNKMEELGRKFAPVDEASTRLWTSMKIGILDVVGGPLARLLNGLTEAGRLMNAYGKMGGNAKVGRMISNLAGASEGNRQSIYQQQQQQFWRYINHRVQQIKDIRAWQSGRRGEALQKRVGAITEKYGLLDVTKIQAEVDAAKKMLSDYQAAAKRILQPVKPNINTKPSEQNAAQPNALKTTPTTSSAAKTETQQNEAAIAKLTKKYQNLATAAKTADDAQKAGLAERMTAIQGEIKTLQDRNAELKKFADEAKGVKVSVGAQGSLPQLSQQLRDLQQAQSRSLDTREWVEYQKQIDVTSTKIDILKGKWKDGQVATFKVDAEAYDKLKELQDLTIEDGTITVKADTAEAYNKVQELISGIEGTTVSFDVKPQAKALLTLDDYRIQAMMQIDAQNAKVDTNTLQTLLKDAMEKGIDTTSLNLEPIAEQISKGINVPDSVWEGIFEGYEELCDAIGVKPIKIDLKTGNKAEDEVKNMKADWKDAAKDVQSLGSALQSIEDPAAKVMGIVAQAIATVALTFSKSLAGTVTPWDWIAAAAAGTATMISTITAIKSATKGGFAEGGIVPGNSFSGDNLRLLDYGVNSGELILNRAQQNNIADQLRERDSGGSMSGGLPYVTGEKIVLGINNWGRSKGYGQLVFSNR